MRPSVQGGNAAPAPPARPSRAACAIGARLSRLRGGWRGRGRRPVDDDRRAQLAAMGRGVGLAAAQAVLQEAGVRRPGRARLAVEHDEADLALARAAPGAQRPRELEHGRHAGGAVVGADEAGDVLGVVVGPHQDRRPGAGACPPRCAARRARPRSGPPASAGAASPPADATPRPAGRGPSATCFRRSGKAPPRRSGPTPVRVAPARRRRPRASATPRSARRARGGGGGASAEVSQRAPPPPAIAPVGAQAPQRLTRTRPGRCRG